MEEEEEGGGEPGGGGGGGCGPVVVSEFRYTKKQITQRIVRTLQDGGETYKIRNEVRASWPRRDRAV